MLYSLHETGQALVEYTLLLVFLAVAVFTNFIFTWPDHRQRFYKDRQPAQILLKKISRRNRREIFVTYHYLLEIIEEPQF